MPSASVRAADSFSNVAYIAAGAFVWLELVKPYHEAMAISLIFLGLVSFAFHATNAKLAQSMDEIGMYAALSVLLWAAIASSYEIPGIYIVMVASWLVLTAFHRQIDSHVFVPALAAAALLFICLFGDWILGLAAAGMFALSWLVNRHGGRYGHSFWHVGTAIALAIGFKAI